MFWAELFLVILEGYLEYLIAAVYESRAKVSVNQSFSEVFSIFLIIVCILALFSFIHTIMNNVNIYQRSKFKSSIGSTFEDIDIRSKWKTAFYLVYSLRRIAYVYIIFYVAHISGI